MKTYLKIKIKSLAAEARIIRDEEKKFKGRTSEIAQRIRAGLYGHRVKDVRSEARSSILAYGFLRGKEYRKMEQKTHTRPNWKRIEQLILKYGDGDERVLKQKFAEWKNAEEATKLAA